MSRRSLTIRARWLGFGAALVAILPLSGNAAEWEWGGGVSIRGAYDSNVFELDHSNKLRVHRKSPTDRANGRVRDMDSVDDYVISPRAEISGVVRSSLGRLSIIPRAAYHYYFQNARKTYPEFGIEFGQTVTEHSVVAFDFDYELDAFRKNYLHDTNSPDPIISSRERVYTRGIYDEMRLELAYKGRLWKATNPENWFQRLTGAVTGGYVKRNFDEFANRDLDTGTAGVSLGSRWAEIVDVDVGYQFADVKAPGKHEVAIIDEPVVGVDLNGDGDAFDNNVRTLARVDRSRFEHTFGSDVKLGLPFHLRAWAGYRYTLFDYTSQAPLDLYYRGRRDDEHVARGGLAWGFAQDWRAAVEGERSWRLTNLSSSVLSDEDSEKDRYIIEITIRRTF